ncbi:hypothetical protein VXI05_004520 [Vibrio parahaemolyticus]|uniref:Uncharacterized protein n=1 Tax=Vibrio parahaemolyticus TaxID=670 RepID=A0AA46L120_VIBPH|nr:hypothetical protein [Vibrio parahaemolyticus]EID4334115.1 hypothetical protein [Vibrio parahaemolyticus]EME0096411.1 hypothetical protein [Vibrio parahaemolyticus]TXN13608.1 hypothetical protein FVP01_23230 [Vibrio parahaemolyticus]HAS6741082.1 hypothetical protein [Vibrio parahaemolyticus]HAS6755828.1 hypothetical protein [Vibrio parahaemolyticus]
MSSNNPQNKDKTVFQIQTENVQELNRAWTQSTRSINESYRVRNQAAAEIQTKLTTLLFSAYTEAIFSKLIHTPYALSGAEISKLKKEFKNNSYLGWKKCVSLVVGKITSKDEEYKSNVKSEISDLIDGYIKEPSEIRNRIAHGQWVIALNTKNTRENQDITSLIQNLDIVKMDIYKKSFEMISLIIEDLVESPEKAHFKFYDQRMKKFKTEQIKMSNWKLSDRIAKLKPKPVYCQECISGIKG